MANMSESEEDPWGELTDMIQKVTNSLMFETQIDFETVCVIFIIKPAQSAGAGFSRIKKIPYQAPLTQLRPQKCTFWKNAFWDPNINVRISFLVFHYGT